MSELIEVQETMEVLIFASNSVDKPKITVPVNPTKKQLETAIRQQTNLSTYNLVWQDALKSTELNNSNSVLSNQGGKGLLYLTPKNNKAGMLSFSDLRKVIKSDTNFKDFVSENAQRFNKTNWTRLSTDSLRILHSEFYNQASEVLEDIVEVSEVIKVSDLTEVSEVSEVSDLSNMKTDLREIKTLLENLPQTILKITNNINEEAFNRALEKLRSVEEEEDDDELY